MTETNQQNNTSKTEKPKGRITLIVIFVIAFVPMALATYMYYNSVMVPVGRTNKGTFILPPLSFNQFELASHDGKPLRIEDLPEKWRLLILSDGACAEACQESLYKARQVNIALHKYSERVVRYYVDVSEDGAGALDPEFAEGYPELNLSTADRFKLKQYLDQKMDGNIALSKSYILVADPIGNIMMFYLPENSGKDMLADLKRLLKVSQIG